MTVSTITLATTPSVGGGLSDEVHLVCSMHFWAAMPARFRTCLPRHGAVQVASSLPRLLGWLASALEDAIQKEGSRRRPEV